MQTNNKLTSAFVNVLKNKVAGGEVGDAEEVIKGAHEGNPMAVKILEVVVEEVSMGMGRTDGKGKRESTRTKTTGGYQIPPTYAHITPPPPRCRVLIRPP